METMNIDYAQLKYYHPTLCRLMDWLEKETGLIFTITSQYRLGDPGVHGTIPLRGTDLRMRHLGIGHEIVHHINQNWVYDPERPLLKCGILHGIGSNLHIHLQVHENTQ